MIKSPPLSPSTKTVTSLLFAISITVFGTEVPFIETAFLISYFRRFITSALPSTRITDSAFSTSGPAGNWSSPYFTMSATLTAFVTSSLISLESGSVPWVNVLNKLLARSINWSLLAALTSSKPVTLTSALHGPILKIVSNAAATSAVSVLSKELGILISPKVFPSLLCVSTSILPILPELCNSLNSRSEPSNPSVCPKTEPITSGLSTMPSIFIVAWIMYLADTKLIFPILCSFIALCWFIIE